MSFNILLIFIVASIITAFLRVIPFLVFKGREVPESVKYLGSVLPLSVYVILVIYNLRGTNFTSAPFGIPEITGVLFAGICQLITKNSILSLILSTITYMVLLRIM